METAALQYHERGPHPSLSTDRLPTTPSNRTPFPRHGGATCLSVYAQCGGTNERSAPASSGERRRWASSPFLTQGCRRLSLPRTVSHGSRHAGLRCRVLARAPCQIIVWCQGAAGSVPSEQLTSSGPERVSPPTG